MKHSISPNRPRAFTPLVLILEDVEDAWWFRSLTADQTVMSTDRYIHADFYLYHKPMPGIGGSNRPSILAMHTKVIHKQCHLAISQDKQSVKLLTVDSNFCQCLYLQLLLHPNSDETANFPPNVWCY